MIEVCCAIIASESRILAVQRGPGSKHPWKWEFPGGKVHSLETPEECIVREIEEELRIGIEILEPLLSVEFDYGKGMIKLIPYLCRVVRGEMVLTEHVALRWITLDEWQTLDWQEADVQLMHKNLEGLKTLLSADR